MPEPLTPRRRLLMDAASTVVAESGLRGLTHRAVDRQANLPEGSCSGYYRTRQALLAGLAAVTFDRLTADVAAVSEELAAHRAADGSPDHEYAAGRITHTFLGWLADPALLLTRLELTLEGIRTPRLGERMSEFRRQLVAVVEQAQVTRHHEPDRARTVVAALDGVLLAALQQPAAEREAFLQVSVHRLLSALRTD